VVVCRHTREKNVSRLLQLFARHVAPKVPTATLTLVGDGPDHDAFLAEAQDLGIAERCHFTGEMELRRVPTYYAHADIFVYTSLSETYGQVVSEALWCGLPVVALSDGMGVDQQVLHGENGFLIPNSGDAARDDAEFGGSTVRLLQQHSLRRTMGSEAARIARHRSDPSRCIERYYAAFESARRHLAEVRPAQTRTTFQKAWALAGWTGLHLAAAAVGLIRKPAKINRHARKPPTWDELLHVPQTIPPPSLGAQPQVDTAAALGMPVERLPYVRTPAAKLPGYVNDQAAE
jgi:hypothetical protein